MAATVLLTFYRTSAKRGALLADVAGVIVHDHRKLKVRQKISGCFRTAAGAENFATLRTVLSTARKQGWSLIQTLQESPNALIAKIKIA